MVENKRNQSGFTLIEVLLSMAMLMVVVVPMLSYFSNNAKYNQQSRKYQRAITVGEEIMEEVKSFATIQNLTEYYSGSGSYDAGIACDSKSYDSSVGSLAPSGNYQEQYVFYKNGIKSDNGTYNAKITIDTSTNGNFAEINDTGTVAITSLTPSNTVVAKDDDFIKNSAISFFKNQNNASGGTADNAEIESHLTKSYLIDISGSRKDIAISKAYVTIKVTIIYKCTSSGCSGLEYTATLYNGLEMDADMLTGIYLFYNYQNSSNEKIEVSYHNYSSDGTTVQIPNARIYAVCQNVDPSRTQKLEVQSLGIGTSLSGDNVFSNISYQVNGTDVSGKNMEDMIGRISIPRIADIKVEIYPVENGVAATSPKVTLTSTRGE